MSVHIIYYKDGAKMMRPVLSRPEYLTLRNSGDQLHHVAAVREGDASQKNRLVQMNYSCLPNADGSLKGSKRMSTTVGMDIDHIDPSEMEGVKERILQKKDELGLLMLERSARGEGYHLVFRRRPEMTQEENLRWASDLLGVAYDNGAKDITRVFFTTTAGEEDLIYLDDEIFKDSPPVLPDIPLPVKEGVVTSENKASQCPLNGVAPSPSLTGRGSGGESESLSYRGIPYSSIIQAYWRRTGGEPQPGERNVRLYQLASHLRAICDNKREVLMQVMPRCGLADQELRAIVDSACKEPPKGISKLMQAVIAQLQDAAALKADAGAAAAQARAEASSDAAAKAGGQGAAADTPPAMPKRLPPLIRLLVSRTPAIYQPAVAHAVFPSLATHLWRVRFPYIDNVEHEATLMCVLMAGTGAGKDCISEPVNRIMADIRLRDEENLRREREWKREVTSKGANKDKRQRPEGLVIQEIDADMTNPAFVMRMAEADGHFLYTKMNEIEQFDALRGSGANARQQFQIMCLSFDPGNRYGQTRVGVQSVTEKVCIRFNWNASTTIRKGQQYFSRVLTDGPISRINFCTIPMREIGAEMPVYGTYDAAFDEQLRPYIDHLLKATGRIECPQALRLAKRLVKECAEFATLSQSRVYENLSFRANVIAYLKAMVLYVAHGCQWSRDIEDFVRWSLQYDLWCKMHFFGQAIAKAMNEPADANQRGPRNMLLLLDDEFTFQDVVSVRLQQELSREGTAEMIRGWKRRKYIEVRTDGQMDRYIKLKYKTGETVN